MVIAVMATISLLKLKLQPRLKQQHSQLSMFWKTKGPTFQLTTFATAIV